VERFDRELMIQVRVLRICELLDTANRRGKRNFCFRSSCRHVNMQVSFYTNGMHGARKSKRILQSGERDVGMFTWRSRNK
jgi:hypothetical protein